jgi:periplasmic divalent cation tolerance protein
MPEREAGFSLVLSTLPDDASARELARQLVDERLIACGNVVPGLTSIYRWEGRVEEAGEVLLVMKTREELLPRLFARAAQLHPYELPELVALEAARVAEAYADWLRRETLEVNG